MLQLPSPSQQYNDGKFRIGHTKLALEEKDWKPDFKGKMLTDEVLIYKNAHKVARCDMNGFYAVNTIFPLEFDLVNLKTDLRHINGWWTGKEWYARRLRKNEKVLAWRRHAHTEDFAFDK